MLLGSCFPCRTELHFCYKKVRAIYIACSHYMRAPMGFRARLSKTRTPPSPQPHTYTEYTQRVGGTYALMCAQAFMQAHRWTHTQAQGERNRGGNGRVGQRHTQTHAHVRARANAYPHPTHLCTSSQHQHRQMGEDFALRHTPAHALFQVNQTSSRTELLPPTHPTGVKISIFCNPKPIREHQPRIHAAQELSCSECRRER